MVKCKKCGSELPDTYKYCIYCSNKLPKNAKNTVKEKRPAPSVFNICVAAAGVLIAAAIIVAGIILF